MAAGVIGALALAWWFAQSEPALSSRSPPGAPTAAAAPTGAEAPVAVGGATTGASEGPEKPLYRWTDTSGVVHFTDVAPADRPYVRVDVDPERNVVRFPAEP